MLTLGAPGCQGRWRERREGDRQWTADSRALTQHTRTPQTGPGLGMKHVFNKPLVNESTNKWIKCICLKLIYKMGIL